MLSQPEVNSWIEEFLDAMSAPADFERLKPLMSKRVSVHYPGEPTMKKFEDWEKKQKTFICSFKGAKRSIPKAGMAVTVAAKKDEVCVVFPEQILFTWTKELQEKFPNVNLGSGEKSKIQIFNTMKISSKKECSDYTPLFSTGDFKNVDRADDEDNWGFKFLNSLKEGSASLVSDECVFVSGGNKGTKDNFLEGEKALKDLQYSMTGTLQPVTGPADKDGNIDAIVPLTRTFKWADGLTERFPGCNFTAGAEVSMKSYEILTVKEGKVIKMSSHMDPATCIKPAGKSGAN